MHAPDAPTAGAPPSDATTGDATAGDGPPAAPREPATPAAPRRGGDLLALGLVLAGHLALAWRQRFVTDDAYIAFRYMRHWAEGHGLRYNLGAGTPVEGFSNFGLVALGALLHRCGLTLETAIPALTAACGAALVVLLFRTLRRAASVPVAALATAAVAWSAPFATWATGGLATMPYALLVLALFERLVLRPGAPDARLGAPLAAALALLRVEGVLWALAILALAALVRRARGEPWRRPLGLALAAALAAQAAFLAWRLATYGTLVANTVQAKVHPGLATFERGLDYVLVQALTTPTFALAALGLLAALRRERRATALATTAMALGFPLFAVLVGGDFMAFGRFLVPALAFDGLLLGWLLTDLAGARRVVADDGAPAGPAAGGVGTPSATRRALAWALGGAVVALGALPAFDRHVVPRAVRERFHFRWNKAGYASEHQRWREQRWRARHWAVLGDALRAVARPGDTVVLGAMGAIGWRSDLTVLDCYGLVTPAVRERADGVDAARLRSPGHDDPVSPFFFLDAEPEWLGAFLVHDRARARVEGLRRELLASPRAAERYVPDVRRVPRADGAGLWLVLWRRLAAGEDAEAAWREAAARCRAVVSGRGEGVPLVEVPPVADLPDQP